MERMHHPHVSLALKVYSTPHVWTPVGRLAGFQTLRVEVAIREVIFAQITGKKLLSCY
jgi:hypothetical protein